jgi:hypothetical protein
MKPIAYIRFWLSAVRNLLAIASNTFTALMVFTLISISLNRLRLSPLKCQWRSTLTSKEIRSMQPKLTTPTITLPPEAVHQLQRLLCLGSALAAHSQQYARSHAVKFEIAPAWDKQLKHVQPWLVGVSSK